MVTPKYFALISNIFGVPQKAIFKEIEMFLSVNRRRFGRVGGFSET
jgi:hypothetical protein